MKRKPNVIFLGLIVLLLTSIATVESVSATPSITILPGSAYVGQYQTIMVHIRAEDPPAQGVVLVELTALNVPNGVKIQFDPSSVIFTNTIESTMYAYAGPMSSAAVYTLTVKATWTNWAYDPIFNPGGRWSWTTTFSLEVKTAAELSWTKNPNLQMSSDWDENVYMWNYAPPYQVWDHLPDEPDHYIHWVANSQVECKATDGVVSPVDTVGEACEFGQQPQAIPLDPAVTRTVLKASVSSYGSNSPWSPWWTGIKFDAWATNTKDSRKLYLEMYFDRTGLNLAWGIYHPNNGYEAVRPLATDIDDYLVYIPESVFSSPTGPEKSVKIVTVGGTTYFTVDLTFMFERACRLWRELAYIELANGNPDYYNYWILNDKTLRDFSLVKTAFVLEAAASAISYPGQPGPSTWATLRNMQIVRSRVADVNFDGKLTSHDAALVNSHLNTELGDTNYLPSADVNRDMEIDQADLDLVNQYVPGQIQLREFDFASSYNPDIRFSKPTSSRLRLDSYIAGSVSLGKGYAFFTIKRSVLNMTSIKILWNVYHSYPDQRDLDLGTVYVFNAAFDRRDMISYFKPNQNGEPMLGYVNVKAAQYPFQHKVGWSGWFTTTSTQLSLSTWSSEYVTVLIRLADNWVADTVMVDVDYVQIVDTSGNTLYDLHFTENVVMETSGTLNDYGVLS